MIHLVNYTLTINYHGVINIEANSIEQAEKRLRDMLNVTLQEQSHKSDYSLKVKSEPPLDPTQFNFLTDGLDD